MVYISPPIFKSPLTIYTSEIKVKRTFATDGKFQLLKITFAVGAILSTTGEGLDAMGSTKLGSPLLTQPSTISKLLNYSANLFKQQFKKTGDEDNITKAIAAYELAVHWTISDDANYEFYVTWLDNPGSSLKSRFDRIGDLSDIENAISTQKKALERAISMCVSLLYVCGSESGK